VAVLATTGTGPATLAAKSSAGLTTRQLTPTCTVTVAIEHTAVCMSDSHSPADDAYVEVKYLMLQLLVTFHAADQQP